MSVQLLLCLSQKEIETPYKFNMTGINVYSFEEALYHVYNYWKESMEDFLCPEFIGWVKDILDEKYLATQILELDKLDGISDKLLKFLSLTDYYDGPTLAVLQVDLAHWEQQLEWERLKDMADMLMKKGEPQKAYYYYKKALGFGENIKVMNNLGICLMELELYADAVFYLSKAYELDKNDFDILINYAESLIYRGDFERAFKLLRKAERDGDKAVVSYLYGKLCQESDNLTEALEHYKKAVSLEYDPFYYYRLAEVYTKRRKFNNALETLTHIKDKDKIYYIKQAEIYSAFDDYAAAVKCMEQAIIYGERNNPTLWAALAKYHRLNYDLSKAEGAAVKSLNIDPNNRIARLELARVKKSQGKMKDYQNGLNQILQDFKKEYRKIADTSAL